MDLNLKCREKDLTSGSIAVWSYYSYRSKNSKELWKLIACITLREFSVIVGDALAGL